VVAEAMQYEIASQSEMDDNLRNETHYRLRWPSCMGLKRAYDALVIKIDSKTCFFPAMVQ
jgi:hypothetical protein